MDRDVACGQIYRCWHRTRVFRRDEDQDRGHIVNRRGITPACLRIVDRQIRSGSDVRLFPATNETETEQAQSQDGQRKWLWHAGGGGGRGERRRDDTVALAAEQEIASRLVETGQIGKTRGTDAQNATGIALGHDVVEDKASRVRAEGCRIDRDRCVSADYIIGEGVGGDAPNAPRAEAVRQITARRGTSPHVAGIDRIHCGGSECVIPIDGNLTRDRNRLSDATQSAQDGRGEKSFTHGFCLSGC
jgi:hypothetical protein